jgi:hypothetical protein
VKPSAKSNPEGCNVTWIRLTRSGAVAIVVLAVALAARVTADQQTTTPPLGPGSGAIEGRVYDPAGYRFRTA